MMKSIGGRALKKTEKRRHRKVRMTRTDQEIRDDSMKRTEKNS